MDRHLTYVAMSRHRAQAGLYYPSGDVSAKELVRADELLRASGQIRADEALGRFAAAADAYDKHLFAAVVKHDQTPGQAAEARIGGDPGVRAALADLQKVATKVWREPEQAVASMARAWRGGRHDQAAQIAETRPQDFGALRGSDRLADALSRAGAERRAAVAASGEVSTFVRAAGRAWNTRLTTLTDQEQARRRQMAVPVPHLSRDARVYLEQAERTRRESPQTYRDVIARMPSATAQEVEAFGAAIEKRFGPDAFLQKGRKLDEYVAPSERKRLSEAQALIEAARRASEEQKIIKGLALGRAVNIQRGGT